MAAKIKYNVGTFKGYNGVAILYLATTAVSGGTEFLAYLAVVGGVDKWTFMSRSQALSGMATQDVVLSSNVDTSKIAETVPTGVADADGYLVFDNAAGLPKLNTGQGFYSLAGSGIAAWADEAGTPVTGGTGTGSTVVVTSKAKSISETLSEGAAWAMKNPIILIGIVVLLLELTGVTNLFGLRPKKKLARRRR